MDMGHVAASRILLTLTCPFGGLLYNNNFARPVSLPIKTAHLRGVLNRIHDHPSSLDMLRFQKLEMPDNAFNVEYPSLPLTKAPRCGGPQ